MVASLLATDPRKSDELGKELIQELYAIFRREKEEGIQPVEKQDVAEVLRRRFFRFPPPKSTGREQFGRTFVEDILQISGKIPPEDLVSTLTEITVRAIADFLNLFADKVNEIYLCGGGAKNRYIVSRLRQLFPEGTVETTSALGYDPDYLEAVLWAYLAYCFMTQRPVDASGFTGAGKPFIPGVLCMP